MDGLRTASGIVAVVAVIVVVAAMGVERGVKRGRPAKRKRRQKEETSDGRQATGSRLGFPTLALHGSLTHSLTPAGQRGHRCRRPRLERRWL